MGGAGSPPQANGPGRDALSTATNGKGSTAGAVQRQPPARSQVPMPHPARPSPAAYTATVTPFDLDSAPMRQARLSARQVDALNGRQIPIPLTSPSTWLPVTQAEQVIQDDIARILKGRLLSVVLYRDKAQEGGDVSVWDGGEWLTIADVELVPARQQAGVAA